MRIRKRTPARAASPGPSPTLAPPLLLQQPKERPHEEDKEAEEEKRVILVAGVRDQEEDDRVPAASENSIAMDDVPKPEPQPQQQDAAAVAVRCSRNDGKRWRCKSAAVPGFLFCDRHVAWSTRKRKPRAKKQKNHGCPATEELAEEVKDEAGRTPQLGRDGGFQPGCLKPAKGGGPGPAA